MISHRQDEGRRSSPCWESDAKVQALRVELADGHSWLVPYSRIALVDCEYGVDHSTLCLRSDTHEIRIVGKNLGELELALQKLAVEWVRESPARYSAQAGDDHAWITSITVSEVQD